MYKNKQQKERNKKQQKLKNKNKININKTNKDKQYIKTSIQNVEIQNKTIGGRGANKIIKNTEIYIKQQTKTSKYEKQAALKIKTKTQQISKQT